MKFFKKNIKKDYGATADPKTRYKNGMRAGIFGMLSNGLLFGAKMAVGILGNSLSIIADAINNLSDAVSSVVTLLGFKMSSKPTDKEHPYGHQRYELISGLIITILIFTIGIQLCKSSVEKIIVGGNDMTVGGYTYIVLGMAILFKIIQMAVYRHFGKSLKSNSLICSAKDSRNDVLSTLAVLIAAIITQFTKVKVSIDGIAGLGVSIFIIISSALLIKDAVSPLLGEKPDKDLVQKITKILLSYDGVLGIHDLMIHNYGANNTFVLVHIEVDAKVDVLKSHELIDNIENDFIKKTNMHLSVHMDPVQLDNEEANRLKIECKKLLISYDKRLSMHDFRIVSGENHTNILFDVVVPFECEICNQDLIKLFSEKIKSEDKKYFFVIGMDRPYL